MRLRNGTSFVVGVLVISALGCVGPEQGPEGGQHGDVSRRFVVELADGQTVEGVQSAAEVFFTGEVRIEPLVEDVPGAAAAGLDRIFVVSATDKDGTANPWDRARALEEALGVERAEPDLERVLEPASERARAAGGCWWDAGVPTPADRTWALHKLEAPAAWALPPPAGGKRFGEGVRVCHPDTGWTEHAELDGALDLNSDRDVIDGDFHAEDPLEDRPGLNPGHGTATGSVIASRGGVDDDGPTGPGAITGVAPKATLVPIRTIKSVIQAFDSDVARAVAYAPSAECDVVSMSLGGRLFFGLERAVRYAVEQGLIVVAAAGNCVGFVVAPAVYDDAIGVAATNFEDEPWRGSSHGSAVTISAPGEDVWCARATGEDPVAPGDGTSFAAAETAGLAALWLAHHGEAAIDTARGARSRQDFFAELLTKTARTPDEWNASEYGPGIANARTLLEEPLGPPAAASPARLASNDAIALARMTGRRVADFGVVLTPDDLRRFGPELSALALDDPEGFEALLSTDQAVERNAAALRVRSAASERLRAAIRNN